MTERLIEKIDRLGAEAGIKEMTPEIRQFAMLVSQDMVKKWDERAKAEIQKLKAERDEIYGLLGSAHLELRQNLEYGYNRNTIKSTLISIGQYAPKLKAKMDELQAKMEERA